MGLVPDADRRVDQVIPQGTDLQDYAIGFIYGDLCQRPQLTMRDREVVVLAALTALGGCEDALSQHVVLSRAVGLTRDEILEIILHAAAYVGFPRAAAATAVASRILQQADADGTPQAE